MRPQLATTTVPKGITIDRQEIEAYKQHLFSEMKKMAADESDLSLVSDNTVINAIMNHRLPEDVAWAILQ